MKGVLKGKMLKKLKTIKAIGYLKPERILHVNALDGYLLSSAARPPLAAIQEEPNKQSNESNFLVQEPEIVDVFGLMKDLEDQELEFDCDVDDKENVVPDRKSKIGVELKGNEICESRELGFRNRGGVDSLCEIDESGFRRPDLDSSTLFDPKLLAAFEQAVMEVKARESERIARKKDSILQEENNEEQLQPPLKSRKIDETFDDPLLEFEEKCPPGGIDSVILYTTGLRGIRKTFEDCHKIRSLLENLRILFYERDVSMHSGYKEEMWGILGGKIVPPRLFIKGRYIGGAEEVLGLHEQGRLKPLIEGIDIDRSEGPCEGCGGIRFVVCLNCDGSRKIVPEGSGEGMVCSECNENGIVICPFCC